MNKPTELLKIQVKQSAAKSDIVNWYYDEGGKVFDAKPMKNWQTIYEIVGGKYDGKVIEKSAVDLVVAVIKNDKPGRPKKN